MLRKKKGQSALEYAALITLLAAVVAFFVWGSGAGTVKTKVDSTYTAAADKIDTAKDWLNATMR